MSDRDEDRAERQWRRALTREQFAHVPQYKGPQAPIAPAALLDLLAENGATPETLRLVAQAEHRAAS